jgi:starch-binding outer membrane protein, SusD/RagB family
MKKIIVNKHVWFLLLLVTILSCGKDDKFLIENPTTFYTTDNAFSTSAQIDQVLVSAYAQLRNIWANPGEDASNFVFRGNGTDMFDVASIRRGNTFNNYGNINADNVIFYNNYSAWYQLIGKANLALYAAELPQITWTTPAEKAYAVAQARFFRAFAYRNLGELFGGVPIVTQISKVPLFNFKRSTRTETYQFAIDELTAIEADLPETTPVGGRLVKGAAQHNLCELYLALGTQLAADGKTSEAQTAFGQSISYGNKVIDGGPIH